MSKRFYIFTTWLILLACGMLSGTAMAAATVANSSEAHNVSDSTFFEGFETGYTHNASVAAIWTQQSEVGGNVWTANQTKTDYNRTPRSGSFNATLYYSNTDWLFTPVYLTAGDTYDFEMYARQDYADTSYANITVMLGQGVPSSTIMTDTLVATTGLTYGDYQRLSATYTATESGIFVLGIKGYINGLPYYISIDDITFAKQGEAHIITCATVPNGSFSTDKTTANYGDTVKIAATSNEGYGLKQWNVTTSNGTTVTVNADSTFIMPLGFDVTVLGEFWKTEGLNVNCAAVDNGSFSTDKTTVNYGDTVKITATPNEGYALKQWNVTASNGTAVTVNADSTFIMPAEYDVTVSGAFWQGYSVSDSVFFEGFESGYAHNIAVANVWAQQSEEGAETWIANQTYTHYNRTPRSGSFNATLQYANTDWLFTPIYLTAGETYDFEMYARQNIASTSLANITVKIGQSWANNATMTNTLVTTTGLTDGDYQKLVGSYTAVQSGIYVLGIKGYIHHSSNRISIDDITFAKHETHSVNCATVANGSFSVDKTTANYGDTVKITVTPDAGYDLKKFNVTTSNGTAVTVAADSTFIMPAGYDVTVSGEFWVAIPTEVGTDGLTYYLISNEAELTKFGSRINEGYTTFNGRLTADIALTEMWTPMGTSTYPYVGTFDGAGYRIANLNVDISINGAGLFGVAGNGAKFKNITIAGGTIKTSGQYAGGIVGYTPGGNEGTISFDRCANYAAVYFLGTNESLNAAGIYGCNVNSKFTVTMTNCYNAGAIGNASRNDSKQENGGLSRWAGNNAVLSYCYNVGTLYGTANNNSLLIRYSSATITNAYYLNTLAGDENRDSYTDVDSTAFASGEVAYLLGDAYGQNIGTDTLPVFRNDTNQVFKVLLVVGENTDSVYSNRNFTVPTLSAGYEWTGCNVGDVLVITQDTTLTTAQPIGTGLSDMERTSLLLYPNPTTHYVTILGLSVVENAENLQVYDLFGRLVLSQKCSGTATETLNISALVSGVYQIRAGEQVVKLIKK